VTITIDKIGLKNPHDYIDPFITVSVKNHHGVDLESPQDTPVASQREVSYIVFGVPVEIQNPVGEIPHGRWAMWSSRRSKGMSHSSIVGGDVALLQVQQSSLSSSTSSRRSTPPALAASPSWRWMRSSRARHSLRCELS